MDQVCSVLGAFCGMVYRKAGVMDCRIENPDGCFSANINNPMSMATGVVATTERLYLGNNDVKRLHVHTLNRSRD
jgi:hypothetical protein